MADTTTTERKFAALRATELVIDEVRMERDRQDAKWGEQNHGATVWLTVLTEEVGELAEAVLVVRGEPRDMPYEERVAEMRKEAVQVAAVAVAMVEWIDRGMPIDGTDLGVGQ